MITSSFDWSFAEKLEKRGWRFTSHKIDHSGSSGHGAKTAGLTLGDIKQRWSQTYCVVGAKGGCKLPNGHYSIIIDADFPGAIDKLEQADTRLAKTLRTQGSRPGHLYIETDVRVPKQAINTSSGERGIDILGVGSMGVIPFSLHRKTGRPYSVIRDADPEYVPWAELEDILAKICAENGWQWVEYEKKKFADIEKQTKHSDQVCAEIKAKVKLWDLEPKLKKGVQSCLLPGHANGDAHPSLSVREDGMLFNCFSKHGGGDIFTWLKLTEDFDFPQALEKLAEKAGVPLHRTPVNSGDDEPNCPEFKEMQKAAIKVIFLKQRGNYRHYLVVWPDRLVQATFAFRSLDAEMI